MSRWLVVAAVVFAAVGSPAIAQTSDSRMGTWKVNLAKSKFDPGPPPKTQTLEFEPSGDGFKMTNDGVSAQGQPTHTEVVARFDGKTYVVTGNPIGPISRVYKRLDARTVESQDAVNNKLSFKRTESVSADGKTMTVTTIGPNTEGRMVNSVAVYEKQ